MFTALQRLLDAPLAVVDLETTGAEPGRDRITEVAVIELPGGATWASLVNPQARIPPAIQALTGITDEMVREAPRFEALAGELYERLRGRILVAHNARFDYGFLRREFEAAGYRYAARTLCTVRLSRRLYPQCSRHNLDSLIARHGLACSARHRALGDAEALRDFLATAAAEHGADALAVAARQASRQPVLPPGLDPALVDAIPEAPGVYFLYGEAGAPLYIGASRAMRSRVLAHFGDAAASGKTARLGRAVRHVEWRRTTGELGALLWQAELVRSVSPAYNARPRSGEGLAPAWPHRGAVGVLETDRARDASEIHAIEDWRYLGTAHCEAELAEILQDRGRAPFDAERCRLLARHLRKRGVRLLELAP